MALNTDDKQEIYIQLLNEGTPVVRPTVGRRLYDLVFQVLPVPDYDPEDEEWEFPPGSIVECRHEMKEGGEVLVAFRKRP